MGGSNCAPHGRPLGFLLCMRVSSEDFQMGSWVGVGNTSPHILRYLTGGKLWHHLKILVMTKFIQCVCVSVGLGVKYNFPFFPIRQPETSKGLLCLFCVCISSSQQTVNPPACLFNIKPKWSIAKHWSMKSKPLIYPCFKTTVIFFSFFIFCCLCPLLDTHRTGWRERWKVLWLSWKDKLKVKAGKKQSDKGVKWATQRKQREITGMWFELGWDYLQKKE